MSRLIPQIFHLPRRLEHHSAFFRLLLFDFVYDPRTDRGERYRKTYTFLSPQKGGEEERSDQAVKTLTWPLPFCVHRSLVSCTPPHPPPFTAGSRTGCNSPAIRTEEETKNSEQLGLLCPPPFQNADAWLIENRNKKISQKQNRAKNATHQ